MCSIFTFLGNDSDGTVHHRQFPQCVYTLFIQSQVQLSKQYTSSGSLVSRTVLTGIVRLHRAVCTFSGIEPCLFFVFFCCLPPQTVNLGIWLCESEGSSTGECEPVTKVDTVFGLV